MRPSRTVLLAPPPEPGLPERLAAYGDLRIIVPASGEWRAAVSAAELIVTRTVHRVDAGLLAAAPRLRAVIQASAGIDNVDTGAARERGVEVIQVEPENAAAVAELTLMSMIALARGVRDHWRSLAGGTWPDRDRCAGRQLHGAAVGIVGLGRVGTRVARLAGAAGMRVIAVDPYVEDERFALVGAERRWSLEALLPEAEFLTLHCPLTPETRDMIGPAELDLLPAGAFVVNTARGEILDEAALYEGIEKGRIAGAALDVFRGEPEPDPRLVGHPAVLPTPHIAGHTVQSRERRLANLEKAVVDAANRLLRGASR
ncbi:MAG: hypothetical protein D6718_08300 [Acidobacteria bacterium]|nr:MAG: hypothetical protein D6718_08300 [Acidobacteriota bacterium]